MSARRYAALDTFRFLAAGGVVAYHFENHFAPFLPAPSHALEGLQHCVDFFFVLSGFVIMNAYGGRIRSWRDYADFLRKRFARLYPLHVATIAAFLALGAATVALRTPVRDASFFDMRLLPAHLLMVHAWGVVDRPGLNAPSWSISAETFVYLLFPALALVLQRAGAALALVAAAALALAIEAVRTSAGLGPGDVATFDYGNSRALPSFLAGMAVCALVERRPVAVPWWAVHLAATAALALMLVKAPAAAILCAFPPLAWMIASAERADARTVLAAPVCVMLGNASFAIYMTHTFFQMAAVALVRKLAIAGAPALTLVALAVSVAIVAAGVASYRWFEDPLRRILSRPLPTLRRADAA